MKMSRRLVAPMSLAILRGWPCCAPWPRPAQDAARRSLKISRRRHKQGPRTDGQIEMDVVHALDASAALKNDLITAATIQGEVTLSGTVSTDASKQLAESIASHVDGVTKVHNNLDIGNPGPDAQNPQPAPDQGEVPDSDQAPAQRQYGELAASGTRPRRESAAGSGCRQQSAATGLSATAAGVPTARRLPAARWLSAATSAAAAVPESAVLAIPALSARPSGAAVPAGHGPVTIPPGMLLQVRTMEPVDSKRAKDGQPVQFTVIQDVAVGGVLAIPRGATVHGVITEAKNAGSGKLAAAPCWHLRSRRSIWAGKATR